MSSGSDAYLSGQVDQLSMRASSGSDVDGLDLVANSGMLDLSGSSDVDIRIEEEVEISLSGGSDLYIQGSPRIVHQDICKACDLRIREE